jgi:hypothetical protein
MTDDVPRCGSTDTSSGDPCRRRVSTEGERCADHRDDDVGVEGGHPNYAAIDFPDRPNWPDASTAERRAALLELWKRKGDYRALNQTQLAREFGVNQSTISRDFDVLSEYVVDVAGESKVMAIVHTSFEKAMDDAGDDPDKRVRATKAWADFLFRTGKLEEEPDRLEVDTDLRVTSDVVEVTAADVEGDDS